MKRILIEGCGGPAGVNFVNSLRYAPEKLYLIGTDINKYHLEWLDTDENYLIPKFTDESYIEKINLLIEKTGTEMIHPQPDELVAFLGEYKAKIDAITFLPDNKTINICQNKFESARVWKKASIPISKSILINDASDLEKAESELGCPYWIRATKGASSRGSTPVDNIETAKHWVAYWKSRGVKWQFVAQEYLPGKNIAFQSIWKDGELITSQARERLEYIYPQLAPSGTTNTPIVAKTINRGDVNQMATDAILSIDKKAKGIFCVDLKENKEGVPIPTEINVGRFFTTSFFFTYAGINMPYLYVKLAYDEPIPRVPRYNALPEGLYWIRHIDAPAVLRRESEWTSKEL